MPTFVSTNWVALRGDQIVVLDARPDEEEFAKGHLQGARWVAVDSLRSPRGDVADMLLAPDDLARQFGELGIDAETEVVVVGSKLRDATQVLIALTTLGHRRAAVMEGGLESWIAEGRALTSEPARFEKRRYRYTAPEPGPVAVLEDVERASHTGQRAILDVRPSAEYAGSEEREVRGGHIPGALNRHAMLDLVEAQDGEWLRPRAELLAAYSDIGLTPERPIVVTCRTGHKASQTWFVLRFALGFDDVRWYDGSWQEWSKHAELPADVRSV